MRTHSPQSSYQPPALSNTWYLIPSKHDPHPRQCREISCALLPSTTQSSLHTCSHIFPCVDVVFRPPPDPSSTGPLSFPGRPKSSLFFCPLPLHCSLFFPLPGESSLGKVATGRGHGRPKEHVWAPWGHFVKPRRLGVQQHGRHESAMASTERCDFLRRQ